MFDKSDNRILENDFQHFFSTSVNETKRNNNNNHASTLDFLRDGVINSFTENDEFYNFYKLLIAAKRESRSQYMTSFEYINGENIYRDPNIGHDTVMSITDNISSSGISDDFNEEDDRNYNYNKINNDTITTATPLIISIACTVRSSSQCDDNLVNSRICDANDMSFTGHNIQLVNHEGKGSRPVVHRSEEISTVNKVIKKWLFSEKDEVLGTETKIMKTVEGVQEKDVQGGGVISSSSIAVKGETQPPFDTTFEAYMFKMLLYVTVWKKNGSEFISGVVNNVSTTHQRDGIEGVLSDDDKFIFLKLNKVIMAQVEEKLMIEKLLKKKISKQSKCALKKSFLSRNKQTTTPRREGIGNNYIDNDDNGKLDISLPFMAANHLIEVCDGLNNFFLEDKEAVDIQGEKNVLNADTAVLKDAPSDQSRRMEISQSYIRKKVINLQKFRQERDRTRKWLLAGLIPSSLEAPSLLYSLMILLRNHAAELRKFFVAIQLNRRKTHFMHLLEIIHTLVFWQSRIDAIKISFLNAHYLEAIRLVDARYAYSTRRQPLLQEGKNDSNPMFLTFNKFAWNVLTASTSDDAVTNIVIGKKNSAVAIDNNISRWMHKNNHHSCESRKSLLKLNCVVILLYQYYNLRYVNSALSTSEAFLFDDTFINHSTSCRNMPTAHKLIEKYDYKHGECETQKQETLSHSPFPSVAAAGHFFQSKRLAEWQLSSSSIYLISNVSGRVLMNKMRNYLIIFFSYLAEISLDAKSKNHNKVAFLFSMDDFKVLFGDNAYYNKYYERVLFEEINRKWELIMNCNTEGENSFFANVNNFTGCGGQQSNTHTEADEPKKVSKEDVDNFLLALNTLSELGLHLSTDIIEFLSRDVLCATVLPQILFKSINETLARGVKCVSPHTSTPPKPIEDAISEMLKDVNNDISVIIVTLTIRICVNLSNFLFQVLCELFPAAATEAINKDQQGGISLEIRNFLQGSMVLRLIYLCLAFLNKYMNVIHEQIYKKYELNRANELVVTLKTEEISYLFLIHRILSLFAEMCAGTYLFVGDEAKLQKFANELHSLIHKFTFLQNVKLKRAFVTFYCGKGRHDAILSRLLKNELFLPRGFNQQNLQQQESYPKIQRYMPQIKENEENAEFRDYLNPMADTGNAKRLISHNPFYKLLNYIDNYKDGRISIIHSENDRNQCYFHHSCASDFLFSPSVPATAHLLCREMIKLTSLLEKNKTLVSAILHELDGLMCCYAFFILIHFVTLLYKKDDYMVSISAEGAPVAELATDHDNVPVSSINLHKKLKKDAIKRALETVLFKFYDPYELNKRVNQMTEDDNPMFTALNQSILGDIMVDITDACCKTHTVLKTMKRGALDLTVDNKSYVQDIKGQHETLKSTYNPLHTFMSKWSDTVDDYRPGTQKSLLDGPATNVNTANINQFFFSFFLPKIYKTALHTIRSISSTYIVSHYDTLLVANFPYLSPHAACHSWKSFMYSSSEVFSAVKRLTALNSLVFVTRCYLSCIQCLTLLLGSDNDWYVGEKSGVSQAAVQQCFLGTDLDVAAIEYEFMFNFGQLEREMQQGERHIDGNLLPEDCEGGFALHYKALSTSRSPSLQFTFREDTVGNGMIAIATNGGHKNSTPRSALTAASQNNNDSFSSQDPIISVRKNSRSTSVHPTPSNVSFSGTNNYGVALSASSFLADSAVELLSGMGNFKGEFTTGNIASTLNISMEHLDFLTSEEDVGFLLSKRAALTHNVTDGCKIIVTLGILQLAQHALPEREIKKMMVEGIDKYGAVFLECAKEKRSLLAKGLVYHGMICNSTQDETIFYCYPSEYVKKLVYMAISVISKITSLFNNASKMPEKIFTFEAITSPLGIFADTLVYNICVWAVDVISSILCFTVYISEMSQTSKNNNGDASEKRTNDKLFGSQLNNRIDGKLSSPQRRTIFDCKRQLCLDMLYLRRELQAQLKKQPALAEHWTGPVNIFNYLLRYVYAVTGYEEEKIFIDPGNEVDAKRNQAINSQFNDFNNTHFQFDISRISVMPSTVSDSKGKTSAFWETTALKELFGSSHHHQLYTYRQLMNIVDKEIKVIPYNEASMNTDVCVEREGRIPSELKKVTTGPNSYMFGHHIPMLAANAFLRSSTSGNLSKGAYVDSRVSEMGAHLRAFHRLSHESSGSLEEEPPYSLLMSRIQFL